MRRYETIIIIDPDLSDEPRTELCERMKDQIEQYQGFLVELDEWGNRKLAYNIGKKSRGHYIRLDYCGNAELVDELERQFKINDAYLKFMTVLLDNQADPEAIKADIEAKAQAAEEATKARMAEIEAAKAAAAENDDSPEPQPAATATEPDPEKSPSVSDSKAKAAPATDASTSETAPDTTTTTPEEKEAS